MVETMFGPNPVQKEGQNYLTFTSHNICMVFTVKSSLQYGGCKNSKTY